MTSPAPDCFPTPARTAAGAPASRLGLDATVSIVIPVYNVAPYLQRCVESVLGQTHRELQVILVDDGSTDGSGELCDEFAARDPRVEVIHQANAGLSAARNAGLDAARGDCVGFVDSDDYVLPDMFSYLLAGLVEHDAQVAVCDFFVPQGTPGLPMGPVAGSKRDAGGAGGTGDPTPEGFWPANGGSLRVLGSDDAIALLVADVVLQNYAWNKLYLASLWDGVRFPEGRVFEDVATTYRVLRPARRVAILPEAKYVYEPLPTGIVRRRSVKNEMDGVAAYEQRARDLTPLYPQLKGALTDGVIKAMTTVWPLSWDARSELTAEMREALRESARFARENPASQRLKGSLGMAGRMTLPLLKHPGAWSRALSSAIYHAYLRRHPEWAAGESAGAGQE